MFPGLCYRVWFPLDETRQWRLVVSYHCNICFIYKSTSRIWMKANRHPCKVEGLPEEQATLQADLWIQTGSVTCFQPFPTSRFLLTFLSHTKTHIPMLPALSWKAAPFPNFWEVYNSKTHIMLQSTPALEKLISMVGRASFFSVSHNIIYYLNL